VIEYFGGTHESAKNDDRKEFNRMLNFVNESNSEIGVIIVYSYDRFSRTGVDALKLIKDLYEEEGIKVVSVTQNIDTTTPVGMMNQAIQMIFGEYENNQRKLKCMAGSKERLKQGYRESLAPYGYDQAVINGEQRITVNSTGEKLRKAFLMKANQGLSNVEIVERLRQMGLRNMYKQKLTKIFANPFYCGRIAHKMLDGEVVKGRQEPLVSEAIFFKVNNLQDQNRHGYKKMDTDDNLPLKRFVKCDKCSTVMTGYEAKPKGIYYYKCPETGCNSNKNAKVMHEEFQEFLKPLEVDSRYIAPLKLILASKFPPR
jgi:site-specific DNA recombinase